MHNLTDEQLHLATEVARFAEAEIAPNLQRWDEGDSFPLHLFSTLGKLGWLGIGFDPDVGGSGGGPIERCVLMEGLARACPGVALGIYVHTVLAANALATVAGDALVRKYVPGMLAGEITGAWAYAEPDSGADVTRVNLRARRDGDVYVLNGSKVYITNGTFADVILVVVRTSEAPGSLKGISVLAVDGDTPGLQRSHMAKFGMRPSELGELHFDDCSVPVTQLVGDENVGFRDCLPVLSQGRIFAGALALGLGGAAVAESVRQSLLREQFGGPLADQQAVRFTIADMTVRLRAARALVYGAALAMAEGRPFDTDASIAKLFVSETATWLAERAMHLQGAAGFIIGNPAQRLYRDCKIFEFGEGINEVQREMIFKAVAKGFCP